MPESLPLTKNYFSEFMSDKYRYHRTETSGQEYIFLRKLIPEVGKKLGYKNVSLAMPRKGIMTYDLMSNQKKIATFSCATIGGRVNLSIGIESIVLSPEKIHETLGAYLKELDSSKEWPQ